MDGRVRAQLDMRFASGTLLVTWRPAAALGAASLAGRVVGLSHSAAAEVETSRLVARVLGAKAL
jgi:hypothetical protein